MPYPRGSRVRSSPDFFLQFLAICGGTVGLVGDPFSYQAIGFYNNTTQGRVAALYAWTEGFAWDGCGVKIVHGAISATLVGTGQRANSQGAAVDGQMFAVNGLGAPYAATPDFVLGGLDSQHFSPMFPFFTVMPGDSFVMFGNTKNDQSSVCLWYLLQRGIDGNPM